MLSHTGAQETAAGTPAAPDLRAPRGGKVEMSDGIAAQDGPMGHVLGPPRANVLRQEVSLAIEKAIFLGTIAPGQRLVESDIATQMGISKAPVREALRSLEQLGLVVNRPRRGTFVTPLTATLAGEAFSLRTLLETYAGRLAVNNVEEVHLVRM